DDLPEAGARAVRGYRLERFARAIGGVRGNVLIRKRAIGEHRLRRALRTAVELPRRRRTLDPIAKHARLSTLRCGCVAARGGETGRDRNSDDRDCLHGILLRFAQRPAAEWPRILLHARVADQTAG